MWKKRLNRQTKKERKSESIRFGIMMSRPFFFLECTSNFSLWQKRTKKNIKKKTIETNKMIWINLNIYMYNSEPALVEKKWICVSSDKQNKTKTKIISYKKRKMIAINNNNQQQEQQSIINKYWQTFNI